MAAGIAQAAVCSDVARRGTIKIADGFTASEIFVRAQCRRAVRRRHQRKIPLRQSLHHGAAAEDLSAPQGQDRYALDLREHRYISAAAPACQDSAVPDRVFWQTG